METSNQEIISIKEIPPGSKLTHENIFRVYNEFRMREGEYGKRISTHPRFGFEIFSDDRLESVRETIEQFAEQLPDIFSSDFGADSKFAKNTKDKVVKEGKPWTSDTQDSMALLSLIEAIGLGRVVTGLSIDKHMKPSERGNFLFKIDWVSYNKDKARKIYVYGNT